MALYPSPKLSMLTTMNSLLRHFILTLPGHGFKITKSSLWMWPKVTIQSLRWYTQWRDASASLHDANALTHRLQASYSHQLHPVLDCSAQVVVSFSINTGPSTSTGKPKELLLLFSSSRSMTILDEQENRDFCQSLLVLCGSQCCRAGQPEILGHLKW